MVGVPAKRFLALTAGLGLALASVGAVSAGAPAGAERPSIYMPPRGATHNARPVKSKQLTYHGGVGGSRRCDRPAQGLPRPLGLPVDATIRPARRASSELPSGVGGSSWHNCVTQYCQGVAVRHHVLQRCRARPPEPDRESRRRTWHGQRSRRAVPPDPVAARRRGGQGRRSTSATRPRLSNAHVQYVIATAHGNNSSGFGTQYCA